MAEPPEGFRSERNAIPGFDAFAEGVFRQIAAEESEDSPPQASAEAPDSPPPPPEGAPEVPAEAPAEEEAPEGAEEPSEPVESVEAGEDDLFTVKVDGVESQVTFEELRRGYQTAQALGRRGREIAEGRQQLEAERAAQSQELAQARQNLTMLTQQLQQEIAANQPNPQELEQLRVTDPAEYSARMLDMQRRSQLLQYAQQQQQAAENEQTMRTVAKEKQLLQDAVPEFAADFVGEFTKLKDFVTSPSGMNVPVEMFNQVHDHRWLALAYDGMRYRQAVQKAPQTRQKVKAKPRIRTAGTPEDPAAARNDRLSQAIQRQRERGDISSTHDAFLALEQRREGA